MKFNALLVSAAMMVMTLAACGDDDPVNPDNNQGGNEDTETVEGDVEGDLESQFHHIGIRPYHSTWPVNP